MLDSLGSQRYSESQIIYKRQLNEFEERVQDLEEQRRALEASLSANAHEQGIGGQSGDEAGRIEAFQAATLASQARVAEEAAQAEARRSLIENQRDMALLQAERKAADRLSLAEQTYIKQEAEAKSAQDRAAAEAERERVKRAVEIENEQDRRIAEAEARAALRIADVNGAAAIELGQIESSAQQAIAAKKSSDALSQEFQATEASRVRSEESRILDEQRMTVALASADAERRNADDIAEQQSKIESLRAETGTILAAFDGEIEARQQQISELNRQIMVFQAKATTASIEREALLAPQLAKLEQLNANAIRLADVTQKLKSTSLTPVLSVQHSGPSSDALQFIAQQESQLTISRANVAVRKEQQIAGIKSQLATELAAIRSSARTQLGALEQAAIASHSPVIDPKLAAATEITKNRDQASIKAELDAQKTHIVAKARTDLAEVSAKAEITKAAVVGPVVTGREVYAGTFGKNPTPYAKQVRPTDKPQVLVAVKPEQRVKAVDPKVQSEGVAAPLQVVSTFKPKLPSPNSGSPGEIGSVVISTSAQSAGGLQPIVVAPQTRTVFNVVYVYKDKASFDQFQNYLKAYGINDFSAIHVEKNGEYHIYAGKYYDKAKAATRVSYLNKTTRTTHAKVIPQEVRL